MSSLRAVAATMAASGLLLLSACTGGEAPEDSGDLRTDVTATIEQMDEYGKVRAVLVQQGDERLLELWIGDDAEESLNLRSITKSVVGTLIGIAIDEGLISGVDATLGELLPSHLETMTPEMQAIPLEAILTHTAGFAPDQDYGAVADYSESSDWVAAILADRAQRGPGDGEFGYSSAGSHILSAVLNEATAGATLDFAIERLFTPLGVDVDPAWAKAETGAETPEEVAALVDEYFAADFAWPTDPQGVQSGDSLLKLRPEDLLNFGLLFLNDGQWAGESVVSPEWVEASTTPHVELIGATEEAYGYQWWLDSAGDDRMFLAIGYAGNIVAVVPDRDLVVVIASEFIGIDATESSEQFAIGDAKTLLEVAILPHTE